MDVSKRVKEKPAFTRQQWAGIIIIMVLMEFAGFAIGYQANSQYNSIPSNCNYINTDNIRAFCKSSGFDSGWTGCNQGDGFTCYRSLGDITQYHCYAFSELNK